MRYLPDTNTLIAVMTRRVPAVMARMARVRDEMVLSAVVAHELYFGAYNSIRLDGNLAEIEELDLPFLPFGKQDARISGEIRATLRRLGTPIGPYDLLIAGQALAHGLIVVTANRREFARVEGLAIEDWTQAE